MITGDITGYAYTQQALGGNALNLVRGPKVGASRVSALQLLAALSPTGDALAASAG